MGIQEKHGAVLQSGGHERALMTSGPQAESRLGMEDEVALGCARKQKLVSIRPCSSLVLCFIVSELLLGSPLAHAQGFEQKIKQRIEERLVSQTLDNAAQAQQISPEEQANTLGGDDTFCGKVCT